MRSTDKFKIFNKIFMFLDICIAGFLLLSFILALANLVILSNIHFVLFVVMIAINLAYIISIILMKIINHKKTMRK